MQFNLHRALTQTGSDPRTSKHWATDILEKFSQSLLGEPLQWKHFKVNAKFRLVEAKHQEKIWKFPFFDQIKRFSLPCWNVVIKMMARTRNRMCAILYGFCYSSEQYMKEIRFISTQLEASNPLITDLRRIYTIQLK